MAESTLEVIHEFDVSAGWVVYAGRKINPFDIVDALQGSGAKLYLHDLDSRERNRPQLDLVQDLTLEVGLWYDGGLRNAESVIDPLVAGAEMVAVDPASMKDEAEFEHVMRLTSSVFLDALSEHEDRIQDYNKSLTGSSGLAKVLRMGYQNFLISPEEIPVFENVDHDVVLNLWLRMQKQDRLPPHSDVKVKIRGTVKGISELVIEDEH